MTSPYKLQTLATLKAKCEEVGNCWIWTGQTDGKGRPRAKHNGKFVPARRLARELKDGREVPKDMQVTARCGDVACISPLCSVVSSPSQTALMAVARGSYRNPARDIKMAMSRRANSWITDEIVRQVRAAESAPKAAALTGVSLAHCKAIRRGDARKDYRSPFAGLFTGLMAANDSNRRAA